MILSSKTWQDGCKIEKSYSLTMTPAEYEAAIKGKVVKHITACSTVSGTWEVRFKKNSPKKHKEFYG